MNTHAQAAIESRPSSSSSSTKARQPSPRRARARWLSAATSIGFAIGSAEMVFMSGPFALYFYGLYSPLLQLLQGSARTAWLAEFWVTHLAPPATLGSLVEGTGILLAACGGTSFLIHAAYLYWVKFRHRAIASRLLYARVRHPQYTCFLIAGAGLVLLWPRFINLLLYLVMAGAYYALARDEERRMVRQFGETYRVAVRGKPMFVPGRALSQLAQRITARAPSTRFRKPLIGTVLVSAVLCGALLTRELSVSLVRPYMLDGRPAVQIVAYGKDLPASSSDAVRQIAGAGENPRLYYVLNEYETLTHLLIDSGVKDVDEHLPPTRADYFVVATRPMHPSRGGGRPVEDVSRLLDISVVRRLDGVFAVSEQSGALRITALLEEDASYAHAAVPAL